MARINTKTRRIPVPKRSLVPANFDQTAVSFALEFDGKINKSDVVRLARSNFKNVPELRSRLVRPKWGYPYWQEHVDFDFDQVVSEKVLQDVTYGDLNKEISAINTHAIDVANKVGWDIYLLQPSGEQNSQLSSCHGTVMLIRIDHSIADGRGCLEIIELLFGRSPKDNSQLKAQKHKAKPMYRWRNIRNTFAVAKNQRPDPISPIKSEHRNHDFGCGWLQKAWPLAEMKAVLKRTNQSTVNDMVMAIICGALQKYSAARDFDYSQSSAHASLFVDLHSKFVQPNLPPRPALHSDDGTALINPALHNYIGTYLLPMPMHAKSAPERLHEITKLMQAERDDEYATSRIFAMVVRKIGLLPRSISQPIIHNGGKSITTSASNLNFNIADDLIMAGVKVTNMRFCGTPIPDAPIAFTMISFKDSLHLNFYYQHEMFAPEDIEEIRELLQAEYDELVQSDIVENEAVSDSEESKQ